VPVNWEDVERVAIAATGDLQKLQEIDDAAPYLQWWKGVDLARHVEAERAALFNVMCLATSRKRGLISTPEDATKRVLETAARVVSRLTDDFSNADCSASKPSTPDADLSVILRVGTKDVVEEVVTRFVEHAWAVLREEVPDLMSLLQTRWSELVIHVSVGSEGVAVFRISTPCCVVNDRASFVPRPANDARFETLEQVVVDAADPLKSATKSLGDVQLALSSVHDAATNLSPAWIEHSLHEYLQTIAEQLSTALSGLGTSLEKVISNASHEHRERFERLLSECRELNGMNLFEEDAAHRLSEFVERCSDALLG
jgi:hypothetical protein